MKYKIAPLKTDEGYSVSVPGLPGCWSQGSTEKEALENIQDAIQEYLAARDELLEGAVVREVEVATQAWRSSLASTIRMPSELCRRPASESSGRVSTS